MNIANWNIRGLNMTYKQNEIRSFVFSNKVSLMGINETKVRFPYVRKSPSPFFEVGSSSLTMTTTRIIKKKK